MKNFEMVFGLAPSQILVTPPKVYLLKKIHAIHGIDVKFNADNEYEFYFQIGWLIFIKMIKNPH